MKPGVPKPMKKPTPNLAGQASGGHIETLAEITLGNVRVSASGTTITNNDEGVPVTSPLSSLSLEDLVMVKDLGKGANGSVSLYKSKSTGQRYAVKKINLSGKNVSFGAAEIRSVFASTCENTVKLFNAFYRDGNLLLAMEYMDGGSLEELLEKVPQLNEEAAAYVASQLVSGLAHMHKKQAVVDSVKETRQVHRDIKPANVMLSRDGAIKLADFGAAGNADSIGLASFVGTATYMSPERIKGQRYGTPSDVWSVGILVAQLLVGHYPFKSASGGFMALLREVTNIQQLQLDNVSAEAQDFVDKCLKQDPEQRQTAEQLLQHPWILGNREAGRIPFRDAMNGADIARQSSALSATPGTPGTQAEPAPSAVPPPPAGPPPSSSS